MRFLTGGAQLFQYQYVPNLHIFDNQAVRHHQQHDRYLRRRTERQILQFRRRCLA